MVHNQLGWIALAAIGAVLGPVFAAHAALPPEEPVTDATPDQPRKPRTPSEPAKSRELGGLWLEANAGLAIAFGGDRVPDRELGLAAGDGVVMTLGGALTPFWLDRLGVGFGLDVGFKYYSLQTPGGGYALRRVPIVGSAHALFAVSDRWFLLAAGGAHLELAIRASRTGNASEAAPTDYPAAIGFMGEAGVLYAVGHVGADITLRYTGLTYDDSDTTGDPDASSFGLFLGIHVLF